MILNLKNIITIFIGTALVGCAGSPVHTSKLSPKELTQVRDYTICQGAAVSRYFKPHINVLNEVKRRRLDCSLIYTTPLPRRSKIANKIHSMKLDNTWVWCKDSAPCVKAINWMKKNIKNGNNSTLVKNYQLTFEKAINFNSSNMISKIGSGVTKIKKPFKLELKNDVFSVISLSKEEAKGFGVRKNSIINILRAPTKVQKR